MVSHQGQRDILRQNRVLPLRAGLENRGIAHRLVVRAHREALPGIFVFHDIEPPEDPPDVLLDAIARLLFDNQRVGAQGAVRQVVFFQKLQILRFPGKLDLQDGLKRRMPLQE